MTGVFTRPQDMQVMEKDKQVKETFDLPPKEWTRR